MTDPSMIRIETVLVSVAIIISFFTCLYTYRVWKSNQSITKKLDFIYKKMLGMKDQ
jgi:hypothetical protein